MGFILHFPLAAFAPFSRLFRYAKSHVAQGPSFTVLFQVHRDWFPSYSSCVALGQE